MWEPGFSLLAWEFLDKQGEEAKMIRVVMDTSWKHQYQLTFKLI